MASEKQHNNESEIGLTLSPKRSDHNIANENSIPPSSEIIVIVDDIDEDVTLDPKNKKPRLGSWWDNVEAYDELSVVVKGLPKTKENNDVASKEDSLFTWTTNLQETNMKEDEKLKSKTKEDESIVGESSSRNKGYGHVTLEDLGVTVEDLKSIHSMESV